MPTIYSTEAAAALRGDREARTRVLRVELVANTRGAWCPPSIGRRELRVREKGCYVYTTLERRELDQYFRHFLHRRAPPTAMHRIPF